MDHDQSSGPTLKVRHTGQVFPLSQAPVTIGRHPDNTIVLSDPQVSRHHATIFWQGGTYYVKDLDSANGTFIDERQISGTRPLPETCALRMGSTIFDLVLPPPSPSYGPETIHAGAAPTSYRAEPPSERSPWPIILGLGAAAIVALGILTALLILFLGSRGGKPTITIQAPSTSEQILVGDEMLIQVTATGVRDITRVEVRVDDILVTTATSPEPGGTASLSATQSWTFSQSGPHVISAVAYTSRDRASEEETVQIEAVDSAALITPTATPGTPTPDPAVLPDLLISRAAIELETGGACDYTSTELGVRVWIENAGAGDAGPFVVDVNGFQQSVGAGLAAGQTTSLWFVGYGDNTAVVDAANQVVESNEDNNRFQQMLPIPTLPPTCVPPATDIPTDTPTPTPSTTPTPSPTPTDTPTPTPTATETPTPIVDFWADEETITAGDSTYLRWRVEHVAEIYLDGAPVTGPDGAKQVNPAANTTYELRAVYAGGELTRQVTIFVLPPAEASVALTSQASLDGFRANNGGGNNGVDIRVGNGIMVGNPPYELVLRGFMSFDLSSIPSSATIKSIELRFYQHQVEGDPYGKLGNLLLKHVSYGGNLDNSAYDTPELDSAILAPHTLPGDWYTITSGTIGDWIADDLAAGRSRLQMRLQFATETDTDGVQDSAGFESGNNYFGTGNVPELTVIYTP